MNPTNARGCCNVGTYTLQYIRSMHSISNVTCRVRTSATVRGSVMTRLRSGTGRQRPPTATERSITGHQRVTVSHRPEPLTRGNAPPPQHAWSGWGVAPLAVEQRHRPRGVALAGHRIRGYRGVERGDLLRSKGKLGGGDVLLQVADPLGTRDRDH